MKKNGFDTVWRPALRGALLFIVSTVLSRITLGVITLAASKVGEESFYVGIPMPVLSAMAFIGTLLIFSSITNLLSVFDTAERERFFENYVGEVGFKREIKDTITSRDFIIEAAITHTLTLFSAIFGVFPELGAIFFEGGTHRGGYFPAVILVPLYFLIFLFSKYEAKRYWHALYVSHDLDTLSVPKFVITALAILFLYPTVFPLAPVLGFMAVSLFNLFLEISKALTVIGTLLVIAAIIFLAVGISYALAIRKRKKFLSKLRLICRKQGYEISAVNKPYKSFFKSECKESFTIKQGERSFECTLISTHDRLVPLVFTSPTDAQFTRRLGTKKHHIDVNHPISFFPAGEGEQVLIVNPSVKFIYVSDGQTLRDVDGPERLWNFTLYRDNEFLGALERGHIGRV